VLAVPEASHRGKRAGQASQEKNPGLCPQSNLFLNVLWWGASAKPKGASKTPREQRQMRTRLFTTMAFLLGLSFLTQASGQTVQSKAEKQYEVCLNNLKNLGTALAMYSTDKRGHYRPPEAV
jgi:hypothetical protein